MSATRGSASSAGLPAHGDRVRVYARHNAAAEAGAWSVERDLPWDRFDPGLAAADPALLASLRTACLVESFHPVHLGRLLPAVADDVDASAVVALELREGFLHFHALRRWLAAAGVAIPDAELVALRRSVPLAALRPDEVVPKLVQFFLSEHLASHYFRALAAQAREPVLQALLELLAADEVRHAQGASDLVAERLAREPGVRTIVLDAAAGFRHFGDEAVGAVPVFADPEAKALRSFARRIERLCGVRLVDHLKASL